MSIRIIRLQAQNVKRLRAVDITPSGAIIRVGGANGAGKSSTLDAIAAALGGGPELPDVPVRLGEEKAVIILDLGDLIVKRTFTKAGGTNLTVENKDGARYPSPQAVLDKLTGKLTFDPVGFIRLDGKKQLEALKTLLKLDFSEIEAKRKKAYDERTLVNRDVETATAKASFMESHPDAPAEEPDPSALMSELTAAQAHNAGRVKLVEAENAARSNCDRTSAWVAGSEKDIKATEQEIAVLQARLDGLRRTNAEHRENHAKAEAMLVESQKATAAFVPIDEAPIREKIGGVKGQILKVRANKARTEALSAVAAIKAKADALTATIEALDTEKEKQLSAAKFPVAGMGFNDTGVTFNGVPFSQASSAEQLRVSVAMAAALNPKLKVMLVRDGSLLDEKSLELLAELARLHELQVWVEMVGRDETCSVVIEDGAVKGAAQEAAPAVGAEA